jgi:hypothetical protein
MAEFIYHEAAAHEATALPVMLPGKLVGRDQTLAAVYGELKQNNPVLLYDRFPEMRSIAQLLLIPRVRLRPLSYVTPHPGSP